MYKNFYDIQWVGRCTYEGSDKIWGWFFYKNPSNLTVEPAKFIYVFWGATGKTFSFKKHPYDKYRINQLIKTKTSQRSYNQIDIETFESFYDKAYEKMHDKFVYHLLADNI